MLYVVDSVSMFRMRYVVDCNSAAEAKLLVKNHLTDDELKEFSQHHIGETMVSARALSSQEEYIELFDEDNDYLADWDVEKKLRFINCFELEDKVNA